MATVLLRAASIVLVLAAGSQPGTEVDPLLLDERVCATLYARLTGKSRILVGLAGTSDDVATAANEFEQRRAAEKARERALQEMAQVAAARAFRVEVVQREEFAWIGTYDFARGAFPLRMNPGISFQLEGTGREFDRCVVSLAGGPDEFLLRLGEADAERILTTILREEQEERYVGLRLTLVPTGRHHERGGDAVVEFKVTQAVVLVEGEVVGEATPPPARPAPPSPQAPAKGRTRPAKPALPLPTVLGG